MRTPRKQARRSSPAEQDEIHLKLMAAQIVGFRIVSGISEEDMANRLGLISSSDRRTGKVVSRAIERLREIEAGMADERVSMVQRYARCVGLRLDMPLVRPRRLNYAAVAIRARRRRRVKLARLQCRSNRRHLVL